jgi:hypothetical protein
MRLLVHDDEVAFQVFHAPVLVSAEKLADGAPRLKCALEPCLRYPGGNVPIGPLSNSAARDVAPPAEARQWEYWIFVPAAGDRVYPVLACCGFSGYTRTLRSLLVASGSVTTSYPGATMPDERILREQAREAIKTGRLPARSADRASGGPGVGALCARCVTCPSGIR